MTKVGSQGNAGRAGWSSRSSDARSDGAANGGGEAHGKQAFQRVLEHGARNFNQPDNSSQGDTEADHGSKATGQQASSNNGIQKGNLSNLPAEAMQRSIPGTKTNVTQPNVSQSNVVKPNFLKPTPSKPNIIRAESNSSGRAMGGATATYETTQITDLGGFLRQFPEAAQAINPILAHAGSKNIPSIAIVNSSNGNGANDIQRIGSTIFMSGDAAKAAASGILDKQTVDDLAAAIGHFMGTH